MQLVSKIRLFRSRFTTCFISEELFVFPEKRFYDYLGLEAGECWDIEVDLTEQPKRKRLKLVATALLLKPFIKECLTSIPYRLNLLNNITIASGCPINGTVFLKLILVSPDQEIIDYAWNDRLLRLIWTKIEVENAFSWLSTLGGAYSALGDYFDNCAEEAGRISIQQYKLSKILGDEGLAARSKLYCALSYSQKGYLKRSRQIVRSVASFGRQTKDRRLVRMCQGVWAKLKYLRMLKKTAALQLKSNGKV